MGELELSALVARHRRLLATGTASVAHAPAAGASISAAKRTPAVAIAPFAGVYSPFYRTFGPDATNPICGGIVDTLVALPARFPKRQVPDPYSLVANSSGGAFFHARVAGRLLDAQSLQIAVIYHFDGNVYGRVPNQGESTDCRSSYGIDAMRQFLIIQK